MTNKFLLNLLGFNPTSRQSRSDSLSLVSRQSDLLTYVGRIAAILVLVLTIGVGNVWGTDVTINFGTTTGYWAAHTNDSYTDSDSRSWSRTYSAGNKSSGQAGYSQFGNKDNTCTSLILTATAGKAMTVTAFSVTMAGGSASTAGTIYLYKRTSGGTETQLATQSLSGSSNVTCSISSNATFTSTDILKVSYVGTAKSIQIKTLSYSYSTGGGSKYTVSFNTGTGNPTQEDITEASGGAGITLPAGPTPTCSGDGWSFAGWKETSAVTEQTTTAPTLLSAGSTFHPSGDVTLYAVYQKGDLSTDYEKITSSAALTSGSNYVVARGTAWGLDANKYTMSSNDGYFGVTAISVSENVISNPNADLIWQISGDNTDGYSLYNSNRNLYIGYSTTYHDLYADGTRHRDYTITFTSSNFYIKSKSESSYYFSTWSYSLQGGGSAYFFEIDNSSAYVVLYKQSGTITYFSNPTCCTPLGSINGSFL